MKKVVSYIAQIGMFLMPFLLIIILYISFDPFMVIHEYKDFNKKSYIPKNRDYVSTEVFLLNVDKYKYDSYIFGSSVALFVRPSDWRTILPKGSAVYSFDASRENIIGIWSKIRYIDQKKYSLKNAVLVIDYNYAFEKLDEDNVLFLKDPRVLHSSRYKFHYKHFIRIFDFRFIMALIDYEIHKEFKPYMTDYLLNERSFLDPVTNEFVDFSIEEELRNDSIGYYERRSNKFTEREGVYCEYKQQISSLHITMLNEMKSIFDQHKTVYKIIIAPNYSQISFNKHDLGILEDVFGEENVFDFTGINSISEDKSNFYDPLHFKVYIGKHILDSIYGIITEN